MFCVTRNFLTVILTLISISLLGQEFSPVVTQYSKKDYNASNQNWAVTQTSDGVMFFGNNQGLLEFDGSTWLLHSMPGDKIVRSLMTDMSDRIFAGSFEEFGYFEKDITGQLNYNSLSSKLTDYTMQNDEIWRILDVGGTVVFQSFTSYFTYKDGVVRGFRCPYTFLLFNVFKGAIYTHTEQKGFCLLDIEHNVLTPLNDNLLGSPVISVLNYDSTTALLVTKSDGLFLFDGKEVRRFSTSVDHELRRSEINRAVISPTGVIVLGTILNGVTGIDKTGKKLWTLNTSNVLQNNTVLGLHCGKDNNLWIALDKGISFFNLSTSIRYVQSFKPSVGAIYSMVYRAPDLYIGTNQGLYKARLDLDKGLIEELHPFPGIKGQVWSVDLIDGQIFCGNNEETYEILGSGLHYSSPVKGGMCIRKGMIHGQEVLVQGTYTLLAIYVRRNGRWVFSHSVDGFVNPVRYIEIDYRGTIWASHLHKGLYSIKLTHDLKKIQDITTYNTLDSINQLPVNVFSVNNRVVFTDHNGFYTFDDIQKKIVPYEEINNGLGYFSQSYRVVHFRTDQYWFVRGNEAALAQINPGDIKIREVFQYAPFLNQTIENYQNIIRIGEDKCVFTLENSLVLYRTGNIRNSAFNPVMAMKSVQTSDAESRKTMFLPLSSRTQPSTPHKRNRILFSVMFPQYDNLDNIKYRYKLEGMEKGWSKPSFSSQKIYNYLPHGDYTFIAEAMTNSGIRLSAVKYSFVVEPPFYLSVTAKIFYMLLILLTGIGIYYYVHKQFLEKKAKIKLEHEEIRRKEIEKRELKIIALQKDKLELELKIKSKELASSTMTIIKKNEILSTIKDEVVNQKSSLGAQFPNKYYDRLIRLLDQNLSSEDDWAIFQKNFDRIHENFFLNLRTKYPELTSNDLRFCAYLHLNLSSKDIANLMNISLKGVEVGRYRIRKKIALPSTKSLTEFMIEFK